jgi:hypothetical protein
MHIYDEMAEDGADEWALVERFAAPSLPAVFKPDDPVLTLREEGGERPPSEDRRRRIASSSPSRPW